MKIMLDCSPAKIAEYSSRYNHEFWQLRTPLTAYKLAGVPYGLDNGCFNFSNFDEKTWRRLVDEVSRNDCKFITTPDMVGDAIRTMDLYHHYKRRLHGLPTCLVLQDGIGQLQIPWHELAAVFVGGSDRFKVSTEAMNACLVAKMLGKWVHVGRVNGAERVHYWKGIADSIDGSGVSRFDERLETVLEAIRDDHPQNVMFPIAGVSA